MMFSMPCRRLGKPVLNRAPKPLHQRANVRIRPKRAVNKVARRAVGAAHPPIRRNFQKRDGQAFKLCAAARRQGRLCGQ